MQQNRRTGFGALLTRGWRLWSGSLGTSFPAVLLCGVLPALVIAVAGYYCLLVAFRPAFQLLQTILQSLLTYGFDEWAIGDAVSRVLDGGWRCGDIMAPGCTKVGCREMGRLIRERI